MTEKELKEIEEIFTYLAQGNNRGTSIRLDGTVSIKTIAAQKGKELLDEVKRLRSIEIMWKDSERLLRKKLEGDYAEIQHQAYHALFDEEKPATCIVCNPQGGQNE